MRVDFVMLAPIALFAYLLVSDILTGKSAGQAIGRKYKPFIRAEDPVGFWGIQAGYVFGLGLCLYLMFTRPNGWPF